MGSGVSSAYYSDVPISLYDGSNTLNDIMEKSRAQIERINHINDDDYLLECKTISVEQQQGNTLKNIRTRYSQNFLPLCDGMDIYNEFDLVGSSTAQHTEDLLQNSFNSQQEEDYFRTMSSDSLYPFLPSIDVHAPLSTSAMIAELCENTTHELKEIISFWDYTLSSAFLDITVPGHTASHNNYLGNYPSALCESAAQYVCVTFLLDYAPRRDNYISFGVAVYDKIPSAELGESFGKLPYTWGLVDRRNTLQPSEIWAEGNIVGLANSLQEKDEISYVLDTRHDICCCKLYLNKTLFYTFGPMEADNRYVMGSTICPSYKVTIVPRDAFQYDDVDDINNTISFVNSDNNPFNDSILSNQQYDHLSYRPSLLPISSPTAATTTTTTATTTGGQPYSPIPSAQPPVPDIFPRDMNLLEQISKTSKKKPRPENRCIEAPASETDAKSCCICLENPKCVVLMPCKHLCVCDVCGGEGSGDANRDSNLLKTCPICRETIKQRIKVFM